MEQNINNDSTEKKIFLLLKRNKKMSSYKKRSLHTHKFPSNPETFGPGLWLNIHILALDATTPEKIDNFIEYINLIASKTPCGKCKKHFLKYIQTNPPENYRNNHDNLGMFQWSWEFHNKVNSFLKKPIIEWESALNIYQEDDIIPCEKKCNNLVKGELTEKKFVPTYGSRVKHGIL